MKSLILFCLSILFNLPAVASLPSAPTDANHPGSPIYQYSPEVRRLTCIGRPLIVTLPQGINQPVPAIVFGHGQALDESHYQKTFEHLAGKGFIAIYPTYDRSFFDQDWQRMGADYNQMVSCAVAQLNVIDPAKIIYSGHSKGAYVASIAAGLAHQRNLPIKPASGIFFNAAGSDARTLAFLPKEFSLTAVYSDSDTIVPIEHSRRIVQGAASVRKQLIVLTSYPELAADHFWSLTKPSFAGGGNEGPFHFYGSYKWLTAAAIELATGEPNPYLFGDLAPDKGVPGLRDTVEPGR